MTARWLAISTFIITLSGITSAIAQDKGGFMRVEKTGSSIPRSQPTQQTQQTVSVNIPKVLPDFGMGINLSLPGLATTNKAAIFDALLDVSANNPSWPAFPRIWHEESVLNTVDTTTYWLPSLKVINGGVESEYKYGMKTTLVMMSSLHKQNAAPGESVEDVAHDIVRLDPESKRVYPNVREGYPMVGFCSFELQLTLSNGQSFGIEMFNAGTRIKHTKVRTVTHTVFSKFFPIPGTIPVQSIMNNYCADTFVKHVRPYAEKNFIPVVVEEIFLHSPMNQCHPNPKDSEAGDYDCMKWYNGFDKRRKYLTVPRCETIRGGFNVCNLKAKESFSCPIYQDKKGERFFDVMKHGLQPITNTDAAFPCDKGLTCKMTKQPKTSLFGLVELKGAASCAKQKPKPNL